MSKFLLVAFTFFYLLTGVDASDKRSRSDSLEEDFRPKKLLRTEITEAPALPSSQEEIKTDAGHTSSVITLLTLKHTAEGQTNSTGIPTQKKLMLKFNIRSENPGTQPSVSPIRIKLRLPSKTTSSNLEKERDLQNLFQEEDFFDKVPPSHPAPQSLMEESAGESQESEQEKPELQEESSQGSPYNQLLEDLEPASPVDPAPQRGEVNTPTYFNPNNRIYAQIAESVLSMEYTREELEVLFNLSPDSFTGYLSRAIILGFLTHEDTRYLDNRQFYFQVAEAIKIKTPLNTILESFNIKNKPRLNRIISKLYEKELLRSDQTQYLKANKTVIGKNGETKDKILKFLEFSHTGPETETIIELANHFNNSVFKLSRPITPSTFSEHVKELTEQGKLSQGIMDFYERCKNKHHNVNGLPFRDVKTRRAFGTSQQVSSDEPHNVNDRPLRNVKTGTSKQLSTQEWAKKIMKATKFRKY